MARSSALNRIVSLVPSITELVCSLGLADQLVGRTGFCIHPREVVKTIPKVGGTKSVNLGKIRALAPTHVIVNVDENRKEAADALAGFVPNLIVTHPLAPEDNLSLYRQIGSAFGKESEAEALCRRFEKALAEAKAGKYKKQKVLYLIWKDPWMTVSRDTYISRTLSLFGLQTIPESANARYPKLKDLVVPDAERILLSTEPYRFREAHVKEIQAETGKPVHLIDGEMTSWYGPRAIAGLRYLAEFSGSL
ncbi:MAG TPA: helical backbone metal receptor [Burkholderiales bacterium]|nr:helical backbone metal receptor [Burkholderiales bacterium]